MENTKMIRGYIYKITNIKNGFSYIGLGNSANVGMYLVCKAIHEQTDIRVILTGEI